MNRLLAAVLAAASCAAMAQAQTGQPASSTQAAPVYTLDRAVLDAGGSAPAAEAAQAGIDAARAGRIVAGLRPNPVAEGQVENIAGSGPYKGLRSAETTIGVALPIELGGKRVARVAVADAQLSKAGLEAAIAAADIRLQVSQLYVDAVAADRRLAIAVDQARIARETLRAAGVRVQAGRASPIEQQRADVARITAEAGVERQGGGG
ncbi:TolC family protein, partial [Rhizorhabdus wittichii]|uniref:TolC family protein n=1 Tax=Rhizorhabdus wittichii TaxID=160791 RepID=UPI00056D3A07